MKRLFRIGSGLFIYSLIPILSWIVLSYVLGDSKISNVFSITYAIQFIWSIIKTFFGTGANIRKEKEEDANSVMNGIFWGIIFSIIIFSIPLILVDKFIAFFGQDIEFYRIYVIYSIALLFIQTLFSLLIEKLYFEDKEKFANFHLFAFNLLTFLILIITALITKNPLISICVTLGSLAIYLIIFFVTQFNKFKIDFKFFKNFKYSSADIVVSLSMLLIYLFGFKTAFAAGAEYLAALNLVGLCTDTQWDTLGAVTTVAKVDISKNRYDYKRELANAYIFLAVLISTSMAMCFGFGCLQHISIKLISIYISFQIFDMLLYPIRTILCSFTQINYSPTINTVISLVSHAIRTIISVTLISAFCTEIGQVVEGVIVFVASA